MKGCLILILAGAVMALAGVIAVIDPHLASSVFHTVTGW